MRVFGLSTRSLPLLGRTTLCCARSISPAAPLVERSATYAIPLSEVLAWHHQAVLSTEAVDLASDGLESSYLLDAVDGWCELRAHMASVSNTIDKDAVLRIPLVSLKEIWRQRLHERIPLQYLTNTAYWKQFVLAVGPGCLIPRPESECIVDFVAEAIADKPDLAKHKWADQGTGSGALAIGIASACPELSQIWAVDNSSGACAWAAFNVQRLQLCDRIKVVHGNWFEPLQCFKGQFNGIVSNPPYIAHEDISTLQAEVRLHEPEAALNGGSMRGLSCLELICNEAPFYLRKGGFLALETGGQSQTEVVSSMLKTHFERIEQRSDMFGITRFVIAFRK